MANKVCEIVTQKFIESLEKGKIPWQRPWKTSYGSNELFPCYSFSTGKRYDILNQMLLDFVPGDYITFEQCKKAGGKVKKGATSKVVVGWVIGSKDRKDADGNTLTDEETGEILTEKTFALRYYRVFNVLDCEGIEPKHFIADESETTTEEPEITPDERAEAIISEYVNREKTLKFENRKGNEAYYSPSNDLVVVPELSQFAEISEYYSTCFHELTHSTLKKSRCDRETERNGKKCAFGTEVYSKEELVAEIGAASLVNISGLETEKSFRNSTAYIQSWISALKNDPSMIVYASARADKAINYILGENE